MAERLICDSKNNPIKLEIMKKINNEENKWFYICYIILYNYIILYYSFYFHQIFILNFEVSLVKN